MSNESYSELSRRLARLELEFSEKLENLEAQVAKYAGVFEDPAVMQAIAREVAAILQLGGVKFEPTEEQLQAAVTLPADIKLVADKTPQFDGAIKVMVVDADRLPRRDALSIELTDEAAEAHISELPLPYFVELARQLISANAQTGDLWYLHVYQVTTAPVQSPAPVVPAAPEAPAEVAETTPEKPKAPTKNRTRTATGRNSAPKDASVAPKPRKRKPKASAPEV